MILAGTGHRPDKLGGYDERTLWKVYQLALEDLKHRRPEKVISGMALGWDTALAMAALVLKIPMIAAVPFKGFDALWPDSSRARYRRILAAATTVHVVCPGEFAKWKLQARNEWMVDRCDVLLALWDGSAGGTANCIRYAQHRQQEVGLFEPVQIVNLWPEWEKVRRPVCPACGEDVERCGGVCQDYDPADWAGLQEDWGDR